MSRPGGDPGSALYPDGRLYFQCSRCGKASRRLDRFFEHIRTDCYRVELDRAPGAALRARHGDDLPIGFVPVFLDDERRPA